MNKTKHPPLTPLTCLVAARPVLESLLLVAFVIVLVLGFLRRPQSSGPALYHAERPAKFEAVRDDHGRKLLNHREGW